MWSYFQTLRETGTPNSTHASLRPRLRRSTGLCYSRAFSRIVTCHLINAVVVFTCHLTNAVVVFGGLFGIIYFVEPPNTDPLVSLFSWCIVVSGVFFFISLLSSGRRCCTTHRSGHSFRVMRRYCMRYLFRYYASFGSCQPRVSWYAVC